MSSPSDKNYYPGLDGLRAWACLGVLAFHLHVYYNPIGWWGVNLFFVLSGFLIGGILLDSRERTDYFSRFYTRRVLRVFPAYYLVLITAMIINGSQWYKVDCFFLYLQSLLWRTYPANPWGFEPHVPGLDHTWTLSVEEMFYLSIPWVIRYTTRRQLVCVLGGFFLLPYAVMAVTGSGYCLWAADNHTPWMNTDGFAVGILLALLYREYPAERIQLALPRVAGLALAAFTLLMLRCWDVVIFSTSVEHRVLSVFSGALLVIALSARSHKLVCWALEPRWLRAIGRRSYGIYLYHGVLLTLVYRAHGAWPVYWGV